MSTYQVQTPLVQLSGDQGAITNLQFAQSGPGDYGPNLLAGQGLYCQLTVDGAKLVGHGPEATWTHIPHGVRVSEIPFRDDHVIRPIDWNNGFDPAQGGGCGQTFAAPVDTIDAIGLGLYAAYGAAPAQPLFVDLRAGGPTGTSAFRGTIPASALESLGPTHPPTLTWLSLDSLKVVPNATYYIELSTSDPSWGVLMNDKNLYAQGTMYAFGGQPQAGWDMVFAVRSAPGVLRFTGEWDITADGPKVNSSMTLTALEEGTITADGFEMVTAWKKDGYDTADPATTPFSRFFDDTGQFIPIEFFKRRPSAWGEFSFEIGANSVFAESRARQWIHATGNNGYDLRFIWSDIHLRWTMSSATMTYQFYQTAYADSKVLNKTVKAGDTVQYPFGFSSARQGRPLPEWYPTFRSSDQAIDTWLTPMYRDRAFLWAAGATATEWKDWMGRILGWTGSPLRDGERASLEAIKIDPTGYVYTWNPPGARGWPFPDPTVYDSRHFTSNAAYVLGIGRYYAWTGDQDFLARMIQRTRSAMNYYLDNLDGKSGLVTIDTTAGGPEHTGRPNSPGVNYWDLVAHGHRDAYTNLYFYQAAVMMAELERVADNRSSANQWTTLATKIRSAFNATFWNDAAGRYVSTVDADGESHDYGSVYVNLEAMDAGLPDATMGERILTWMDHAPTELTTNRLLFGDGSIVIKATSGGTLAQQFVATDTFAEAAAYLFTYGHTDSTVTISLRRGGPSGEVVATKNFPKMYDGAFYAINFPTQPEGTYVLELSQARGEVGWLRSADLYSAGVSYQNGSPLPGSNPFRIAVVSPYQAGPADTMTKWGFTPRATTRKNNFWYMFAWQGVILPWGDQLEDGGGDLYLSGFDITARAKYRGPDDAYSRLMHLLDRYSMADRLCGGSPLIDGTAVQNEVTPGPVGVDVPFPESGLAPVSALYALMGVQATPAAGLTVTPNLPHGLSWIQVDQVHYRGANLTLKVTTSSVEATNQFTGARQLYPYRKGETVKITP